MADGGLRPQDEAGHVGRVSVRETLLPGRSPVLLKAATVSTALADYGGQSVLKVHSVYSVRARLVSRD